MPAPVVHLETAETSRTMLEERPVEPALLVIFGATGDLARRKLIPALYRLSRDKLLPEAFAAIGFSRSGGDDGAFRGRVEASTRGFAGDTEFDAAAWATLAARIHHVPGNFDDPSAFLRLGERVREVEASHGVVGRTLFYLATPPEAACPILKNLRAAGLLPKAEAGDERPWPRVVMEKPFGHDLDSAQALNEQIAELLREPQIYRIDHYLGKETVQNILVFRFGNAIFEPLWNRRHIDHVEITAAETLGMEGRGRFYDGVGVLRDVVQNHLLQVLALCAMEPPVSFAADDLRNERVQVLKSIRPALTDGPADRGMIGGAPGDPEAVLGQYEGYTSENEVDPGSRTPTFAALKVMIDNWRWQGVPFYLRAGKGLAARTTEVSIHFEPVPFCLFGEENVCQRLAPNVLTLRIQPDEGISLCFEVKVPGENMKVTTASMDFGYDQSFAGAAGREAYERLLLDAMRGDAALFMRRDTVEQAWRFVTPILEAHEQGSGALPTYGRGSQGPREADAMLRKNGHHWKRL